MLPLPCMLAYFGAVGIALRHCTSATTLAPGLTAAFLVILKFS